MKISNPYSFLVSILFLSGCIGASTTGRNYAYNHPYFITTQKLVVKKILVPIGTRLVYEEQDLNKGEQDHILDEKTLITMTFPTDITIDWGGVPVTAIHRFFNTEMRGYSVYADFNKLAIDKKTKFSKLWESCSSDLAITVNNLDDWSFNTKNISDVTSCSVLYQRYFKDDKKQQNYLDDIYTELQKISSK